MATECVKCTSEHTREDWYVGQQIECRRPPLTVGGTTIKKGPQIEQESGRRNLLVLPPRPGSLSPAVLLGHQTLGVSTFRLWDLCHWPLGGSWASSIPTFEISGFLH